MRTTDSIPAYEEPSKLHGSTKSRKVPVRPRAGNDGPCHPRRQHQSRLQRRWITDCGSVWTTELSIMPEWTTNIQSHWSRRCSSGPVEIQSPDPNQRWRRVTKLHFSPGTNISSNESFRADWRTYHLTYHQTAIQISGEKSSAKQCQLKWGMTLPDTPECRTRVHLPTEKFSSDKWPQRAVICVRDESTYTSSIRKMISQPVEFTAGAQRQRQWE